LSREERFDKAKMRSFSGVELSGDNYNIKRERAPGDVQYQQLT